MNRVFYNIKIGPIIVYENISYTRARILKKQLKNEGFRDIKIKRTNLIKLF